MEPSAAYWAKESTDWPLAAYRTDLGGANAYDLRLELGRLGF